MTLPGLGPRQVRGARVALALVLAMVQTLAWVYRPAIRGLQPDEIWRSPHIAVGLAVHDVFGLAGHVVPLMLAIALVRWQGWFGLARAASAAVGACVALSGAAVWLTPRATGGALGDAIVAGPLAARLPWARLAAFLLSLLGTGLVLLAVKRGPLSRRASRPERDAHRG